MKFHFLKFMINITAKCYLTDFYMDFHLNFPLQPKKGNDDVEKRGKEEQGEQGEQSIVLLITGLKSNY